MTPQEQALKLHGVGKSPKKPIIGILGGVCSGKSTVAAEFAKLGCKVIDADKIAHRLLDGKTVKKKLIALFGRKILKSSGRINRKKLGTIVFSDKCRQASLSGKKLTLLNKIIHPLVLAGAERLIKQYNRLPPRLATRGGAAGLPSIKAIVLDMPLLVEVGWHKRCNWLIFVDCKRKKRLKRAEKMPFFAKNRLKTSSMDSLWRENFQIPLDKKARISDNTIDNNSDLSSLVRQVAEIFSRILKN